MPVAEGAAVPVAVPGALPGAVTAVADLAGWAGDDHAAAFAAFRRSAEIMAATPPAAAATTGDPGAWQAVARAALALPAEPGAAAARAFFESRFVAFHVSQPGGGEAGAADPGSGPAGTTGFLTGYFEPELIGARRRSPAFPVALLARPDDLVAVDAATRPTGLDPSYAFARRLSDGRLVPYFDRAAIEDGALAGRGLELAWLADPVDAYFVHVQGSCRIRFDDGGTLRLAYDGKAGHPYTSIARLLIARGVASAEAMTADVLARWLREHPAAGRALMRENRSYIFFAVQHDLDPALGAVAGGGVALTPGRSAAVDRAFTGYGAPLWLDADLPLGAGGASVPFRRLMVAQDTGSAIVGPARADVFVGCGAAAGLAAGRIRHVPRTFAVFVPQPNQWQA